jgi:hypothetical protein
MARRRSRYADVYAKRRMFLRFSGYHGLIDDQISIVCPRIYRDISFYQSIRFLIALSVIGPAGDVSNTDKVSPVAAIFMTTLFGTVL